MEYGQMSKAPSNVQEMPGQMEGRLNDVRAAVGDYMSTATERAREAAAYADRHVQNNPWTAVGVGFGVGMIFGALLVLAARAQQTGFERLR